MRAVVNSRVCASVKLLYLIVVAVFKSPVNPITSQTPVFNHLTRDNINRDTGRTIFRNLSVNHDETKCSIFLIVLFSERNLRYSDARRWVTWGNMGQNETDVISYTSVAP
jgi:hypothetical protein